MGGRGGTRSPSGAGPLSGRGSPPTRPAPPRPGRGLPLPLPPFFFSSSSSSARPAGRLASDKPLYSASAIFSPPSGGGAAQARWAPAGAGHVTAPAAMLWLERGGVVREVPRRGPGCRLSRPRGFPAEPPGRLPDRGGGSERHHVNAGRLRWGTSRPVGMRGLVSLRARSGVRCCVFS